MELKAAACTWRPIICLVLLMAKPSLSINCYICGPGSTTAFQPDDHSVIGTSTPSSSNADGHIKSCLDFDSSPNKTDFERHCPSHYFGCSTQIEGGVVSRMCETLKIESCGQLNDATYCMCAHDLCNAKPITSPNSTETNTSEQRMDDHYSDDEDYDETGSGQEYYHGSSEESRSTPKLVSTDSIPNQHQSTTTNSWTEIPNSSTDHVMPRGVSGSQPRWTINVCLLMLTAVGVLYP